jgi:hypothetical protein
MERRECGVFISLFSSEGTALEGPAFLHLLLWLLFLHCDSEYIPVTCLFLAVQG